MPKTGRIASLYALFAEEWEYRMRNNPLAATSCGDHRFNDRMPEMDEASLADRARHAKAFLARLQEITRSRLPAAHRLNYDLFARDLEMQIKEYEFHLHWMPISRLSGFQIYLPDIILQTPFHSLTDYENYLKRLEGMKTFFEAQITLMRKGLANGYTPSSAALSGVERTVSAHLVLDARQSVFFRPFESIPDSISAEQRARLQQAAEQTVIQSVLPAYRALNQFLVDEYLPGARQDPAAASLPDGLAYYQYCIRRYTTLPLSAAHVHQTGLDEVRRIRSEMQSLLDQSGFQGSLKEFIHFLRTDKRFFVDTPEALMKEVALIMKRMEGELPHLFKTLPRTPFGLRQIPEYLAPNSTSAYYFPASGDGKTAGFYYVNTYDLKSRPLYEYEALSFHEAVPGHHLQLALQFEMNAVPDFRRFSDFTAFIEGWALYAERLGLEIGFYQDIYSNFGRLTFEIWRACRLVVDTGLHAFGWSRQQAIDFMAENSSLSLLNIANEVDRYIAWPGQALAYKIGELKIRQLRQYAETALGERFNVREFHDQILCNGSIPLDLLEEQIHDWVEGVQKQFDPL